MYNIGTVLGFFALLGLMFTTPIATEKVEKANEVSYETVQMEDVKPVTIEETNEIIKMIEDVEPITIAEVTAEPIEVEEEELISREELELLALVTMAEAEGESEEGKRLVIDTVLNRVDSDLSYFPDTITEVIYQKDQFTSMWNGRVDKCYVDEEICQLILEELEYRTNYDVLYFHADKYGKYGTPLFSVGNHYFSSI